MLLYDKYNNLIFILGGLAEEVTEKDLHATFIPFGDIVDINMPLDYETEKHRGFSFIGWFKFLIYDINVLKTITFYYLL